MTGHLTRDLETIKRHVLRMAGLAEEALGFAVTTYVKRQKFPKSRIAETEERIDRLQLRIDDEVMKCLALHQPVAGDLRFIMAATRIVNDLERVGDLASSISERLSYVVGEEPIHEPIEIDTMLRGTAAMLRDSLNAFVNLDAQLARDVLARDDAIDEMHRKHFSTLINRMKKDPGAIEHAVALLSISKGVERVADMATNISEDVVFMVEAQDIRHPGEREEEDSV